MQHPALTANARKEPMTSRKPTTGRNLAATTPCGTLPFDADVTPVTFSSSPNLRRALRRGPFVQPGVSS